MSLPNSGSNRVEDTRSTLDDGRDTHRDDATRTTTTTPVADHTHPLPPRPEPHITVPTPRRDEIRWAPVWAGVIIALATFLLLEVSFFALGWLTPGADEAGIGRAIVTGLIGLFAFFLGGLTAGATAMWDSVRSGVLHGVMVWALGFTAILLFTVLGGGALLGSVADALTQTTVVVQAPAGTDVSQVVDTARGAAADAALALGLAWIAAVIGGLVGTKMWAGKEHSATDTRRP